MPINIESILSSYSEYDLKLMVSSAQRAMERSTHANVQELAATLINTYTLDVLKKVSQSKDREKISKDHMLLAISVLGMLRIWHVDINNQLKNGLDPEIRAELTNNIQALNIYYQSLDQYLPNFSIHQHATAWSTEIAQDLGNFHKIVGNVSEAMETLWRAIEKSRRKNDQIADQAEIDINLLEFFDHSKNEVFDAVLSSQAVCEMRLGTMTDDLGLLCIAVIHQWKSMGNLNIDRLVDMHLIVLKHLKEHKTQLTQIIPAVGIGLSTLFTIMRHHKKFVERARLYFLKK